MSQRGDADQSSTVLVLPALYKVPHKEQWEQWHECQTSCQVTARACLISSVVSSSLDTARIRGGIKVTRSRTMWVGLITYAAASSFLIMDTTAWIFDAPHEVSKVLTRMLFHLAWHGLAPSSSMIREPFKR
jgi:hypothetical protein